MNSNYRLAWMNSRRIALMVVVLMTWLVAAGSAQQPAGRRAGEPTPAGSVPPGAATVNRELPPVSYVCPMPADAEVLEDKPGNCPKCGMQLLPIRLDLRYACPVHQTYVQDQPGVHRYDGRELVPVTLSIFWTCNDQRFLEPGKCGDGTARKEQYEQRPHGDHNPKHGGQFFMAPDAWHHVEGTYPRAGLFRMFFYNDYSKPLPPKGFTASVTVLDDHDQPVVANLPLHPGAINNVLEAEIPTANRTLPMRFLAHVTFTPAGKANPFNFTFTEPSKDPAGP